MSEIPLQIIASDYASHGLGVYPALPQSKEPAGSWRAFQWQPPSESEREALFSINCNLNIGVICGAASGNLAALDCETPRAFEEQLRHVERAGYGETWTVGSNRGGHIYLRLPVTVKPIGKVNDVEVRSQGQFILLPPSQHPNGPFYEFINRPQEIIQVGSLSELDWLPLEAASTVHELPLPRKARQLLVGYSSQRFQSRSEAEQAIMTVLVNASFTFNQILSLFEIYPAAGKFTQIRQQEGLVRAVGWLRTCFDAARNFCATESPARLLAREALAQAQATPWPGRTGSTDRAIFCAHATLACRSGREIYHASSRDLAEIAACQRRTASNASRRLGAKNLVELISHANSLYASRYRLTAPSLKVSENAPLPTHLREGVVQTSSFLLPDAFRGRSLGKSAYEVITTLNGGFSSVLELERKTGRHPQTVRAALRKLLLFGFVRRVGRKWQGSTIAEIEERTAALGMAGALDRQKEKHRAERLRFRVSQAVLQTQKAESKPGKEQGSDRRDVFHNPKRPRSAIDRTRFQR